MSQQCVNYVHLILVYGYNFSNEQHPLSHQQEINAQPANSTSGGLEDSASLNKSLRAGTAELCYAGALSALQLWGVSGGLSAL